MKPPRAGATPSPWYSGPNPWVKEHLRNVLDLDESLKVVTFGVAEDGVTKLGVGPGIKKGFAAEAFAIFGNALASATTSGQLFPPMVILDDAGLNHASSNSGVVRADGEIDRERLAQLKSFAGGKDHLTLDDLRRFLWSRFSELQKGSVPLGERMRRFVGNLILSRGEFGPLFAVASIENPAKKGERILPLARVDEFYDNKLFTRVRAEREAALIKAGVPVHDGPGSVAGALAAFARQNGGPTTGNAADLAHYASQLLEGRTVDDLARLRNGIGLASIAGPAAGMLVPNAKSLALALCPAFKGSMPKPAPAGIAPPQGGGSETQRKLNAVWDQAARALDPTARSDAELIAVAKKSRAEAGFEMLFNDGGVGAKCFFVRAPGGFVTWPLLWEGNEPPYTFRAADSGPIVAAHRRDA